MQKVWGSHGKVLRKSCERPEKFLRKSEESPADLNLPNQQQTFEHLNNQPPKYGAIQIYFVGLGGQGESVDRQYIVWERFKAKIQQKRRKTISKYKSFCVLF